MRKLFATILAFFYLFSATGINVHMHYCMDKLGSWNLSSENSVICPVCGMEKKEGGCCKDESKFFKNTSDQQNTEMTVQLAQVTGVALPVSFIDASFFNKPVRSDEEFNINFIFRSSPPPGYILNCVFRS